MEWVHSLVDQVHGCGPWGHGAPGHPGPSLHGSTAEI
jgi:hypothetical protein